MRLTPYKGYGQSFRGGRTSTVVEMKGWPYTVGQQISAGYREYKCSDGYTNDVVCMVCIPIG